MIRFACPGCKSVLSGRDEQAGKIVTCPKCGQRMQAPRPATVRQPSHRPRIAGIAVVGVLLLAGVSGIWLWTHSLSLQPGPTIAAVETLPLPSKSTGAAPAAADKEPLPSGRAGGVSPLLPPEQGANAPRSPGIEMEQGANAPRSPGIEMEQGANAPRSPGIEMASKPPLPPVADTAGLSGEEKKEIALADDLPPELPFDLVDAINVQRAKAGVGPVFLDAEASRACQARAEYLARHGGRISDKELSANDQTVAVAAEAPLAAVDKWLKEPKRRAAILEPHLRTFGAGFARNVDGQWFSVFDWTHGLDREPPLSPSSIPPLPGGEKGETGAIIYPTPGQMRVPLWFPGNETPDPLPQTKDKLAGYPITLMFPPPSRIEAAAARLSDKGGEVPVWLSTPEKPANPQFAESQQNTICLIAKKPLRPDTRYHVEVSATVNGAAWSAKWDFATVSEGEIHQEMAGTFLRTLNRLRRRAGLPPVPLDAERSKVCAAHARYLVRNVAAHPALNWNDEKADLPGYTVQGAAVARTASIQGGGGPVEAVTGLIDSLISRPQLLDPHLHDLGLGYTPFAQGGWIWVIDLHRMEGGEEEKEYFYPAPDQENVPLNYPPNEVPNPIPTGSKDKLAGYAITALFGPRTRVTAATAKLVDDKGNNVDAWFSTPEKPAIAGFPQHSLCLLPKAPLRPDTRYTATFQAEVNGRPWRRTWSFTTLKEPNRYSDDLDEKILAQVNAVRKMASLSPVRLDAQLSCGCQSHARYLALNHHRPAALGMGVHREDADLPGASPEGAKAAKHSVIAVVLDPQICVENWMATLYHRIPLLAPNLERIGFGHARIQGHKWACVLDTGNGRTPPGRDR